MALRGKSTWCVSLFLLPVGDPPVGRQVTWILKSKALRAHLVQKPLHPIHHYPTAFQNLLALTLMSVGLILVVSLFPVDPEASSTHAWGGLDRFINLVQHDFVQSYRRSRNPNGQAADRIVLVLFDL